MTNRLVGTTAPSPGDAIYDAAVEINLIADAIRERNDALRAVHSAHADHSSSPDSANSPLHPKGERNE